MDQTDSSPRSEPASGVEPPQAVPGRGREYLSKIAPSLRRGVESGSVTAIIGGTSLLGGFRAFLGGERKRGLARLAVGAVFLAVALVQRRSHGAGSASTVEQTDVVDTGPGVESVADETGEVGENHHATGDAAVDVADTSLDLEDASSGLESESDDAADSASVDQREIAGTGVDSENLAAQDLEDEDLAAETEDETGDAGGVGGVSDETTNEMASSGAGTGTVTGDANVPEDVDRLGEAAFDRQSREVPAPQRAFNQGFLAHSAEAFWGIRTSDDAVLVSQDYDAIAGRDGVTFVTSSEIGDDARELPIPDAILGHWDEVIRGGTAVAGGDDVLFVTTDDLADDGLLRVLPSEWADDATE